MYDCVIVCRRFELCYVMYSFWNILKSHHVLYVIGQCAHVTWCVFLYKEPSIIEPGLCDGFVVHVC